MGIRTKIRRPLEIAQGPQAVRHETPIFFVHSHSPSPFSIWINFLFQSRSGFHYPPPTSPPSPAASKPSYFHPTPLVLKLGLGLAISESVYFLLENCTFATMTGFENCTFQIFETRLEPTKTTCISFWN